MSLVPQNAALPGNGLTLYQVITTFNNPKEGGFWKYFGKKGENAGNQHFLLFPKCFLPFNFNSLVTFILSSANAFNLDQSEIKLFGTELMSKFKVYADSKIYVTEKLNLFLEG